MYWRSAETEVLKSTDQRRMLVLMKPFLFLLLLAASPVFSGCSQLISRSNAGIRCLENAPAPAGTVATGAKYAGWVVSAPLVAALIPAAALAWATP